MYTYYVLGIMHYGNYRVCSQIFTIPEGETRLTVQGVPFPVRAQCFALYSPDPERLAGNQTSLLRLERDQYTTTFTGCGMWIVLSIAS